MTHVHICKSCNLVVCEYVDMIKTQMFKKKVRLYAVKDRTKWSIHINDDNFDNKHLETGVTVWIVVSAITNKQTNTQPIHICLNKIII